MTTTVFRNGSLFDGHRYHGRVGSVLVRDGRVEAVVDEEITGDQVVDLAGGLLTPGFTDAHVHAVQGGLERIRCDLSAATTREEYLTTIQEYAAANPDLPWILGGGWAMAAFPGGTPRKEDLDAIVPDRPVFLPNRDHHGAWVNSRALALAGIRRDTPDPADGRAERDAAGEPTGTLHEGAMDRVAAVLPATTRAELREALLAGQSHLHSVGVTGWQDAIVGAYAGMDDNSGTYVDAAATGELTAYVVGALWWDRERGLEQIPDLVEARAAYSGGRFRATSVKIMQDGVAENGTAAMLAPYLDACGHPGSGSGHSFVDPQVLARAVPALAAEGFQVHVHAIGDRGVREALDAFARIPDPAVGRHHMAHLQVVDPDDVGRFGALGVAANMQMLWAVHEEQMTELTIPFLGPERAATQYPFAGLAAGGARLVAGSDWPVSTPDPWQAIHAGVNRISYEDPRAPFLPEQALPLEAAVAAYTSGSAWVNHRDDAGTVAPGSVADLVVHDRDPFAGPPEEIGATKVVQTYVDGLPVFSA